MTAIGEVFDSLTAMSQWQLLLAFSAAIGYTLAQGALLEAGMRASAALIAVASALGFVLLGPTWAQSAMLVAFSVAGVGTFVAAAWVAGRLLGFGSASASVALDSLHDEPRSSIDPEAAGSAAAAVAPALHVRARRAPAASA